MTEDKLWSLCISRYLRCDMSPRNDWERAGLVRRVYRIALLLTMALSVTVLAQAQQGGPPFTEPPRLCPKDNPNNPHNRVLDVTLETKLVDYTRADGVKMQVRAYNIPDSSGWQYCDGKQRPIQNPLIPGPTFQLRKGTSGKTNGDKFKMTLVNKLPVDGVGHECNPIRDFSTTVNVQPNEECNADKFPLVPMTMPACFHGDNVTNFHFHGFHVSPQPHQDFVLLNLYPEGTLHVTPDDYNAVGSYQYNLDPLPYSQAEGTHWYHPHKHGSTALQVLNGMAGVFVLTGPFDDWLNSQYGGDLEDKVLVVQQIFQEINFFSRIPPTSGSQFVKDCPLGSSTCTCKVTNTFPFGNPPPTGQPTLVNGQINPTITMRPGEIQRWRIVNSMVQLGGLLNIGFAAGLEIKQIAQDGVQFSPENYAKQPLLGVAWFVPGQPPQMLTNANLAPGNRVDYLVKAPMVTTQTCYTNLQSTVGNVNVGGRRQLAAPPPTPNALLTVCVDPSLGPKPMEFPTPWFPMPPFLADIPAPSTHTTVAFSMTGPDANNITGNPNNNFFIDGVQYCPHCANHTLTLNTAEEWTITNASSPQHPFHLHVNPHQLVETGFMIQSTPNGPYDTSVPVLAYTPPVWEDTIALIKQGNCWDLPSGPLSSHSDAQQKCPEVCASANKHKQLTWKGNWVTTKNGEMSVCGCCAPTDSPGYTKIRVLPTDFTGETVLHCHILGHEDRGMMQNVQMVCPTPHQTFFGKPRAGQPECVPDNYLPAAKQCPASYPTGDKCAL